MTFMTRELGQRQPVCRRRAEVNGQAPLPSCHFEINVDREATSVARLGQTLSLQFLYHPNF